MFVVLLEIVIIAVWVTFFVYSMNLFMKSKRDIRNQSFSMLGSDKHYGYIFNLLLIATGFVQLLLFLILHTTITKLVDVTGQIGYIFLCVTTLLGIFTGIFPLHYHRVLHKAIAAAGFISAGIGWIMLGLSVHSLNCVASYMFGVFGFILVPLLVPVYLHHKHDLPAVYESMFFISAFVTNILLLKLIS